MSEENKPENYGSVEIELETAKLKRRGVQVDISDDMIQFCEMENRIEELEKEIESNPLVELKKLLDSQKPLDPEIAEIISESFWEMYDRF